MTGLLSLKRHQCHIPEAQAYGSEEVPGDPYIPEIGSERV